MFNKNPDLKKEIINSILLDDLSNARRHLDNPPEGLELLIDLLKKVSGKKLPLMELKSSAPKVITTAVSYTCGIGCEMCNAGFSNRSSLFDDYKYLSSEQFDEILPWIDSASFVVLAGMGETMNSPYISCFLDKLHGKTTFLTTSGMTLNREMISVLIQSGLHYLNFSFDGKTSAGHGAGDLDYIKKFWKKVEQVQKIKRELSAGLPLVMLTIAIDGENISNLDEIMETAHAYEISVIDLIFMIPHNRSLFEKSIFVDFEESKKKINAVMKRWNQKGMYICIFEKERIENQPEKCFFVDKHLIFNLNRNLPFVCCGPITMPVEIRDKSWDKYWNSFCFRYFRYLHFYSDTPRLPLSCRNCWILNPEKYLESAQKTFTDHNNISNDVSLYRTASSFKKEDRLDKAEEIFLKVIKTTTDNSLKGNIYFHLGEIEIKKINYTRALHFMKLAVQHCFDHRMAFAYLYLLFMLLGEAKELKRQRISDLNYLNKLDERASMKNTIKTP